MSTDATVTHTSNDARKPRGGARAKSIDRFCDDYGLGRSKVYELIREGKLRAVKCGARALILADDEARFVASLPEMAA